MNKIDKMLLPVGRCNNCFWYFHQDKQDDADETGKVLKCPKCKTDEYLMDMPEIVTAVNCHEELLEALKEISRYPCLTKLCGDDPADSTGGCACASCFAAAAIARIEGGK